MKDPLILVVDDSPDDVSLALDACRRSGIRHRTVVAGSVEEALLHLRRSGNSGHDLPSLVLLDLKMPPRNGMEVLHHLRASPATRLLPAVILTSSGEPQDIVNAYRLGANSYIRKPVAFEDFLDMMGQLIRYWLILNLPPPRNSHTQDIP